MLLDAAIEITERVFGYLASGAVARGVAAGSQWAGTLLLRLISLGRFPQAVPTRLQIRVAQSVGMVAVVGVVAVVIWWLGA